MAAKKGYQPPSRDEVLAMRAQKGQPATGPVLEASRRAQAIRDGLDRLPMLTDAIIEAYRQDDWKTLGYASFTAYAQAEFGEERLNLSPAQRSVMTFAFVEAGMSKRAAAAAIGVDESTVRQDLKVAGNPAGPMAPSSEAPQVSGTSDASTGGEEPPIEAPNSTAGERTGAVEDPPRIEGSPDGEEPETVPGSSPLDSLTGQPHAADLPEVDPPSATGQSGVSHPSSPGEASAESARFASGAGSHVPEREETPEGFQGPQPGPSGVDPQDQERSDEEPAFAGGDPVVLVSVVEGWAKAIEAVEVAEGAVFTDGELDRMERAAKRIADHIDQMRKAWEDA